MVSVGYSRQAISGFSMQSLQKALVMALNFGKIFILARLLSPNDFGLFSLVMIAIGLTESFTQTGINVTIVQSNKSINYFLSTAWVIAILRGFLIGSLMLALAFLMRNFYQEELLLPLIAVAALIPVIKGFINPAIAQWQKNFNFAREGFYHSLHLIAEGIFQILLAYFFQSAWALVFGVLLGVIVEVCLSFLMNREKPQFQYYPSRAKNIFANAKFLGLASLLAYLNDNADDFVLGKVVGTTQLGIYHNAYALSHKANYELAKSAHHGLMPVFTKLQHSAEKSRLKKAFFRSLFSTLAIGLIISIPIFIWPDFFVQLILGEQWLSATQIVPVLLLAGLIHSIANIAYALLISQKQYRFLNSHLALSLVLMLSGIIMLSQKHGLLGACWGIALARLVSLPLVLTGVKKVFKD